MAYMREQAAKLSRGHDLVKAIYQYLLKRWHAFTLFLGRGRVCMSNNAAEGGLRWVALGRKSWLFCGSDCGGRRAADMYGPPPGARRPAMRRCSRRHPAIVARALPIA
jgi:transposase